MQEIILQGLDLYQATVQKRAPGKESSEIQETSSERAWLQHDEHTNTSVVAPPTPPVDQHNFLWWDKHLSGAQLGQSLKQGQWRGAAPAEEAPAAAGSAPGSADGTQQRTLYSTTSANNSAWLLQTPQLNLSRTLSQGSMGLCRQSSLGLHDFLAMAPPPPSRQSSLVLLQDLLTMALPPPSRQSSLVLDDFLTMAPPPPSRQSSLAMAQPPAAGTYNRSQASDTTVPKAVFVSQFNHPPVQESSEAPPIVKPALPAVQFSLSEQLYLVRKRRTELLLQERQKQQKEDENQDQMTATIDGQNDQDGNPLTRKAPGSTASTATATTTSTMTDSCDGGLRHSPRAPHTAARVVSTSAVDHAVQQTPSLYSKTKLSVVTPPGTTAVSVSSKSSRSNNGFQSTTEKGIWKESCAIQDAAVQANAATPSSSASGSGAAVNIDSTGYSSSCWTSPCPSDETSDDAVRRQQHLLHAHGRKLRQQLLFHLRLEEVAASKASCTHDNTADNATMQHQLQLLSARTKNLQQQLMCHQRLEAAAAAAAAAAAPPNGQFYQPSAANAVAYVNPPNFFFDRNPASLLQAASLTGSVPLQQQQQHLHNAPATAFPSTTAAPSTSIMMAAHRLGGSMPPLKSSPATITLPCLPCNLVDGNTVKMHKRLAASNDTSFLEQLWSEQQHHHRPFNKRRKIG